VKKIEKLKMKMTKRIAFQMLQNDKDFRNDIARLIAHGNIICRGFKT
jgi:hypothetical protein